MGMMEAISGFARRASSWAELHTESWLPSHSPDAGGGTADMIYRLRHWPTLPSAMRTADVLRMLSLMSNRPVSRRWMLSHGKLPAKRLDALLDRLATQGALEEINPASFPPGPPVSAAR
jgi:hypothetical protein